MPLFTAKEKSARLEESDNREAHHARQSEPTHPLAETAAAATSAAARFYDADGYTRAQVRSFGLFGCLAVIFSLTGCADFTMTNPPRTATEQLLLSTAADRALKNASLEMFRGKRVFIDGTYFDSYDAKYVIGALRDTFSQAGALLAPAITNSDIIVEARSGAFSTDFSSSLIGIPNLGLPIPLVGVISMPELALYKSSDQRSLAKFALLAYESKSREHYYSSGPLVGNAYANIHKVLFFLWVTTDIPEKKSKKD